MTYFELLGLPRSVDIDPAEVDRRFRELSLSVHPDRLVGADAATRRRAAEVTTSLTEAVKVLKDRASRAFYLLKLEGVDLTTETGARTLVMPGEFLEEIMERREALDAARQHRDLAGAHRMAQGVREQKEANLAAAEASLRAARVPEATLALGKVRYYGRFLEEVDALEDSLLEAP